jgi:predicted CopG family antitoxin
MIAIKERIYNELSKLKKKDESFSDVIENLLHLRPKKNPIAHFGIGKDLDPEILDEFEKGLVEHRKKQQARNKILNEKWE